MVGTAAAIMAKNASFIAVGAMHLPGDDGLIRDYAIKDSPWKPSGNRKRGTKPALLTL